MTNENEKQKPFIITREAISIRAYQLFLERGGEPGKEDEDWLKAEQELLAAGPEGSPSNPIDPSSATGAA